MLVGLLAGLLAMCIRLTPIVSPVDEAIRTLQAFSAQDLHGGQQVSNRKLNLACKYETFGFGDLLVIIPSRVWIPSDGNSLTFYV